MKVAEQKIGLVVTTASRRSKKVSNQHIVDKIKEYVISKIDKDPELARQQVFVPVEYVYQIRNIATVPKSWKASCNSWLKKDIWSAYEHKDYSLIFFPFGNYQLPDGTIKSGMAVEVILPVKKGKIVSATAAELKKVLPEFADSILSTISQQRKLGIRRKEQCELASKRASAKASRLYV
jgi:hypothetical protein